MKNELGLFERRNNILVSSRIIAERFEKHHFSVVSTIESVIENSRGYQFRIDTPYFQKQTYIQEQNGKEYTELYIK